MKEVMYLEQMNRLRSLDHYWRRYELAYREEIEQRPSVQRLRSKSEMDCHGLNTIVPENCTNIQKEQDQSKLKSNDFAERVRNKCEVWQG